METRGKSNTKFCNDVNESLARHESSFDQVNTALKIVIAELKSLRTFQTPNTPKSDNNQSNMYQPDTNPFAPVVSSL